MAADDLTLEWVQRKFVSVLTQQGNGTFKYVSRLREIVRDTRNVQDRRRRAACFRCPPQEPGDFVLVLRNASGAELNRLSYTVAGEGQPVAIARAERRAADSARQGRLQRRRHD